MPKPLPNLFLWLLEVGYLFRFLLRPEFEIFYWINTYEGEILNYYSNKCRIENIEGSIFLSSKLSYLSSHYASADGPFQI